MKSEVEYFEAKHTHERLLTINTYSFTESIQLPNC